MKVTQMRTGKDYSELAIIARGLATITCILAETQRQVKDWESFIAEKGKVSDMP